VRGNLESRGRNVWRAKVYLGCEGGKSKRYLQRTIHGTKRQAEDVLNELLVEAGQSSNAIVDGTFGDLAQQWLDLSSQALSPTTRHEYERLLDRLILPKFGKTKVRAIRASDLDTFYANLARRGGQGGAPLGAQSIRHVHALIRRLLNQAVKWSWITVNPAARASPPRVIPKNLELPAPEAIVRLLTLAGERDPDLEFFLRLAAVTGARRGEVCALRWSDLEHNALRISRSVYGRRRDELNEKDTKTHAVRRVALDPATLEEVKAHRNRCRQRAKVCAVMLAHDGFIFSDEPDGSVPWRPNRVTLAFSRLCRDAGVTNVRLHDLRHFAATQLLAAGVPVRTVAGRLGHANAATTLNVYAHVLESSDEEAAGVLGRLLTDESAAAS
jgi:integrase